MSFETGHQHGVEDKAQRFVWHYSSSIDATQIVQSDGARVNIDDAMAERRKGKRRRIGLLATLLALTAGSCLHSLFRKRGLKRQDTWILGVVCICVAVGSVEAVLFLMDSSDSGFCVSPTQLDFGTVQQLDVLRSSFTMENKSYSPIQVRGVLSSCDCAIVHVRATTLAGGQSAEVPFTWNVGTSRGRTERLFRFVYLEDGNQRHTIVRVIADVIPEYTVTPRVLKFHEATETAHWQIEVRSNVPGKIDVLEASSTHSALRVDPPRRVGDVWYVAVHFDVGRWRDEDPFALSPFALPRVRLATSSDVEPVFFLPVEATVLK